MWRTGHFKHGEEQKHQGKNAHGVWEVLDNQLCARGTKHGAECGSSQARGLDVVRL